MAKHRYGKIFCAAAVSTCLTSPAFAASQGGDNPLNLLFLTTSHAMPLGQVFAYHNLAAVENFFGVDSGEGKIASDFFKNYTGNSATLFIGRVVPDSGRARIFGYPVQGTLSTMQATCTASKPCSLSLSTSGYTIGTTALCLSATDANRAPCYTGGLSAVTTLKDVATQIGNAVNGALPTEARMTGNTIAPASCKFTGYITAGVLHVTGRKTKCVQIGGTMSGLVSQGTLHVLTQETSTETDGSFGGTGTYGVWYYGPAQHLVPSQTITETWGVLTVGAIASGTIAAGQVLTDGGVHINVTTPIMSQLSGSGSGSKWVVLGTTDLSTPEDMTSTPCPIDVNYKFIRGANYNNGHFWVEQNAVCNENPPPTITYATGSAASLLGLTEGSGLASDGSTKLQSYLSQTGETAWSYPKTLSNIVDKYTGAWTYIQVWFDPDLGQPPFTGRQSISTWATANGRVYLPDWTTTALPVKDYPPLSAASSTAPASSAALETSP
jgi:hypothetical protein